MSIIKGYDGSIHAPSSERSSEVKIRGHVKEHEFSKRIDGDVIKGRKKPDVIKDEYRYSVKGADKSIQFMLLTYSKSGDYYGIGHPMYNFVVAGYNHRKFKFDNNNFILLLNDFIYVVFNSNNCLLESFISSNVSNKTSAILDLIFFLFIDRFNRLIKLAS